MIVKRITLINGIGNDDTGFEGALGGMIERCGSEARFDIFNVRDMDIGYCCGCWGCWVKTPGECVIQDDMPAVLKSVVNSDLVVFISPLVMGFVSPLLKKVNDRMIPVVHPYVVIDNGECHHLKRYDHYPKLGLVLVDRDIDKIEGLGLISDIYKRMALNLKSELAFTVGSAGSVEGFENEIKRI
jgi:multimeric flavodoxin WrbA